MQIIQAILHKICLHSPNPKSKPLNLAISLEMNQPETIVCNPTTSESANSNATSCTCYGGSQNIIRLSVVYINRKAKNKNKPALALWASRKYPVISKVLAQQPPVHSSSHTAPLG